MFVDMFRNVFNYYNYFLYPESPKHSELFIKRISFRLQNEKERTIYDLICHFLAMQLSI